MMYGYARVSAKGQDFAAQVAELKAAGCDQVFTEKASAAGGRKRPELRRAMSILGAGDCLVVTRLNRLARSARDALNTLATVREKGADFKSLREGWADTTTPMGRFMLTFMSGLAEFDREMILERTGEGRESARARGVKLGRRPTLNARQLAFVRQQRAAQPPVSLGQLAALLKVSVSTISRAAARDDDSIGHAPTCAVFTSGSGNAVRCTCGQVEHGAEPHQVDLEELLTPKA